MSHSENNYKFMTFFFLITVYTLLMFTAVREFTREILVERLNISDSFVRIVLFDQPELYEEDNDRNEGENTENVWMKYSLEETADVKENNGISKKIANGMDDYEERVTGIENKITEHVTERLPFYHYLVVGGNWYEKSINWNYATLGEYNAVVELEDNYFASLEPMLSDEDIENMVDELDEMRLFCEKQGIDFLYVAYPQKISEDDDITGVLDYSNYNRNNLVSRLTNRGISCVDLRYEIDGYNKNWHEMYYDTDHHWKLETGLDAANVIIQYMPEKKMNTFEFIDRSDFDQKVYKRCYMGSAGEKLTEARAVPDDIQVCFPRFETHFHYEIPSGGVDISGNFLIMYNFEELRYNQWGYSDDAYGVFDHGDTDVKIIKNLDKTDGIRVLMIHDSFNNVVSPFLSLNTNQIDEIDLRYYHESIYKYIEESKPDVVVIAYSGLDNETLFNFE